MVINGSNYLCTGNDGYIQFSSLQVAHSAVQPSTNCSLSECTTFANTENICLAATAPCYSYRMANGSQFCAPGILCSILEPCDNQTLICSSSDAECIINSCCSSQYVCIPRAALRFCSQGNSVSYSRSKCRMYQISYVYFYSLD